MGFKLKEIVPWGRNLSEYLRMFNLTRKDLNKKFLDCAGGPSSFNCELTSIGGSVVSCDPIYKFSGDEISQRIDETYDLIVNELYKNKEDYIWQHFTSPDEVGKTRLSAMKAFLDDYGKGKSEKRYILTELPDTKFAPKQFDIALCSHFLFTYSNHLTVKFHLDSIYEMLRVANEARIFPVINIDGQKSNYLETVMKDLAERNYTVCLESVNYAFQKGANEVLIIKAVGEL